MRQTIQFIKENYGIFLFDCKQYDALYNYMLHDKKNKSGIINFTLLNNIGEISINQTADNETIFEMFDFYRECIGCLLILLYNFFPAAGTQLCNQKSDLFRAKVTTLRLQTDYGETMSFE